MRLVVRFEEFMTAGETADNLRKPSVESEMYFLDIDHLRTTTSILKTCGLNPNTRPNLPEFPENDGQKVVPSTEAMIYQGKVHRCMEIPLEKFLAEKEKLVIRQALLRTRKYWL